MSDQFDRSIRSKIYSVESDVPDFAWRGVEQQLRPRRDRRWLFLLLLPLVSGAYWALKHPGSNDEHSSTSSKNAISSMLSEIGSDESALISRASTSEPPESIASNSGKTFPPEKPATQIPRAKKARDNKSTTHKSLVAKDNLTSALAFESLNDLFTKITRFEIENKSSDHTKKFSISMIEPIDFRAETIRRDPKIDVCPSFSTSLEIRPFFELLLSGGLPSKSFTLREPELSNYQTLRERTEKERSSFTIQALFGADIGDRFEIKAGLGATHIFEVFDYIDESATRTIKNIIIDTILVDGVPEIRKDTSIVTQYGQRIKLSQNRYTALELPLMAAYKFKVQNHQFFVQGGTVVNLALWTKGDILTSNETITSIDTKESRAFPIYKSRTGLDVMASLGYELELGESNKLRLVCSFRKSLGDFTAPEFPLGQRYNHYHLGASWKHQF